MSDRKGAFTFVLHSHLPYCRRAGRWPHGEEWLHEAISETYLPLLNALYDLVEGGYKIRLTISLTPVLAEQLADPLVLDHFEQFVEGKIELAEADIDRFTEANEEHLAYLARFYHAWYQRTLDGFRERFGRDIIGAFKKLQDEGHIEILTSAATHAYLPLLERDSSIYGQLAAGVESYKEHFGRAPRAAWLPECAYRPAFYATFDGERRYKPGIEEFLAELDLKCFFAETHTIEGGRPVGKAAGDVLGPYGAIPKRYVVPIPEYEEPAVRTTFRPYYVAGAYDVPSRPAAEVAVIGRNNRTSMQVWSADWGYPGDYDYREFHKKDGVSGLQYWRVTGARTDLAYKDYYHPDWAQNKVGEHARHFAWLVEDQLSSYHEGSGEFGIIASCYDAELFGHWWFEGVDWIREVLKILSRSETVKLATANEYLEEHPPEDVLALPEGSWGAGGGHWTWDNYDTHWMWPLIHRAERRMEGLVAQHPAAQGAVADDKLSRPIARSSNKARRRDSLSDVLNQAARELLLLQSSDWPFLVTTGQAREYAIERFNAHVDRFHRLADIAEADGDKLSRPIARSSNKARRRDSLSGEAPELVQQFFELDNIFPHIDYRLFADRERRT